MHLTHQLRSTVLKWSFLERLQSDKSLDSSVYNDDQIIKSNQI